MTAAAAIVILRVGTMLAIPPAAPSAAKGATPRRSEYPGVRHTVREPADSELSFSWSSGWNTIGELDRLAIRNTRLLSYAPLVGKS